MPGDASPAAGYVAATEIICGPLPVAADCGSRSGYGYGGRLAAHQHWLPGFW
jgi:hypothetical protein